MIKTDVIVSFVLLWFPFCRASPGLGLGRRGSLHRRRRRSGRVGLEAAAASASSGVLRRAEAEHGRVVVIARVEVVREVV